MIAEVLVIKHEANTIVQFLNEHNYIHIQIVPANQLEYVVLLVECDDIEFLTLYVAEGQHRAQQKKPT